MRNALKIFPVLLLLGCASAWAAETPQAVSSAPKIEPECAVTFYPTDPSELSSLIERYFLNIAERSLSAQPIALWVPHGNINYSGQIAAMAYYEAKKWKYDAIILVGPSHQTAVNIASIYPRGNFQTPLGEIPIDEELAKKIAATLRGAKFDANAYAGENSLEVQWPFLAKCFEKTKVVPILMGPADSAIITRVAKAIAEACKGRNVLLIASSDMSHSPNASDAKKIDSNSLGIIKLFEPELIPGYTQFTLNSGIKNLSTLFCGDVALGTVMRAARLLGANQGKVLGYTHSGEVTRDNSRVVGYGAAAFFHNADLPSPQAEGVQGFFKDIKIQNEILSLARSAIEISAGGGKLKNVTITNPEFFRPCRVFVTLRKDDALRGRVGNMGKPLPLYEAIAQMATAAASKDRRFSRLTAAEAKKVTIEISLVQNIRRIAHPELIELGTHGVIVHKGKHQGFFLPELTGEYKNVPAMLSDLCMSKAGLPGNAWKDETTEIYVFDILHFGEI